jgi:carboxypeptidase C (cathepsin A)
MAGHLIPLFAKEILAMQDPDINLKGVALEGAWMDPFYQLPAHRVFAE